MPTRAVRAATAITGGSYGGYLVFWILGHDKRVKATCSQRGGYDLSTFFGEGNAWRLVPNYFGGYPWEEAHRGLLQSESPLTSVPEHHHAPYHLPRRELPAHRRDSKRNALQKPQSPEPPRRIRPSPRAPHEITRAGNNPHL
ncbi:alpha/beta hydrolase family protein [Rufibacter sp. XAAS-G3-1]|uniref:alpha/beta hydrolase family protein n=1 Tax=Rufibacter sp. XAAS-G3-1 TaxID=2729134 RepID=UPI00351A47C3